MGNGAALQPTLDVHAASPTTFGSSSTFLNQMKVVACEHTRSIVSTSVCDSLSYSCPRAVAPKDMQCAGAYESIVCTFDSSGWTTRTRSARTRSG